MISEKMGMKKVSLKVNRVKAKFRLENTLLQFLNRFLITLI